MKQAKHRQLAYHGLVLLVFRLHFLLEAEDILAHMGAVKSEDFTIYFACVIPFM